MKTVIQRVTQSSVSINHDIVASINNGLLILIGIQPDDSTLDVDYLVDKIIKLRIFEDQNNVMNLNVIDVNGQIMVVSQFTLLANTKKGNRPSYINAAKPEISKPLYLEFIQKIKTKSNLEVKTGVFGADMKINLTNDGPVTILIDSKNK